MNINSFPQLLRKPIDLDNMDRNLIALVQKGLPLCEKPYAVLAERMGMSQQDVIQRLRRLLNSGAIKRMGVIVRHHEIGYRANAMVVWNIADEDVSRLGRCIGRFEFVTLCYQRPRHLPAWPYNLFCMIHGRDRNAVLQHVAELIERCDLRHIEHDVLFSRRRFKQRGAIYHGNNDTEHSENIHANRQDVA